MSGPILYGIPNCDTVKKARNWLAKQEIKYTFHDFRKDGLTAELIKTWLKFTEWETLLNQRSTTWRKLAEADKQDLNQGKAIKLMTANPSLIKRPVLTWKDTIVVGFEQSTYRQQLKND